MIVLILKLLIAHVLGDFVFQPNKWISQKKKKKHLSVHLYFHLGIHVIALLLLLGFDISYWIGVVSILITHGIIDILKLNIETKRNTRSLFLLDQLAHLVVIGIVVYCYTPFEITFTKLYSTKSLLFILALLNITFVGAILMRILMGKWILEDNTPEKSLNQAGKYIGILERLFVFGFIVLNQWAAIGLLITAKSVFRFGDLSNAKDRKLTEYVLIGTLLSFGMAIGTGLLYLWGVKCLA